MKPKGILKGNNRKDPIWKRTKIGEPYKDVLDRFRKKVLGRRDFDPTSLLQFGLFMARGIINILKEAEEKLGKKGQKVVNDALIKTGYEMGHQIISNTEIPEDIKDIELMSFLATIINTQAWTSLEDPKIDNENQCSFDILWCPLQDIYNAFDCRVQRYLVQGIIEAFKDSGKLKNEYQIEFRSTIPAGAETCLFVITKKKLGENNHWEKYSEILEKRALNLSEVKEKKKES